MQAQGGAESGVESQGNSGSHGGILPRGKLCILVLLLCGRWMARGHPRTTEKVVAWNMGGALPAVWQA